MDPHDVVLHEDGCKLVEEIRGILVVKEGECQCGAEHGGFVLMIPEINVRRPQAFTIIEGI